MNASEALAELVAAAKLNPDRAFSAPWEARAFAIAVYLSGAGAFEWKEFAQKLIDEVAHSDREQAQSGAHAEDHYYEHFLRALERVLSEKKISA